MTAAPQQRIEAGERLPAAVLEAPGGSPVDLRQLRHDSLVAVFCHAGCRGCAAALDDFDGVAADVRGWGSLPAAVVEDRDEALRLGRARSFPVLVDDHGRVRTRLGLAPDDAAVLVADRFGTVYRVDAIGPDHSFPSADDLRTEARYVAIQCPECSVPAWSW